jgi:hypothetical protein
MEKTFNKLITLVKILLVLAVLYYGIKPFLAGGKFHALKFSELLCIGCIAPWQWALLPVFSIINWFLETLKWKLAASEIEKISLFRSLMGVLTGTAVSCLVPWKVGEFLGKITVLKPENKLKGSVLAVLVSMSQYSITLLFGILGTTFLLAGNFNTDFSQIEIGMAPLLLSSFVFLIVIFLVFFPLRNRLLHFLIRHLSPRWKQYFADFKSIPQGLINKMWILSLLRYLSFIAAYAIIIDPDFTIILFLMPAMMTVFLIQSILPGFLLSDLPVKGMFHLILFSAYVPLLWKVGNAVLLVFIFNQLIPALLGAMAFWLYIPQKDKP